MNAGNVFDYKSDVMSDLVIFNIFIFYLSKLVPANAHPAHTALPTVRQNVPHVTLNILLMMTKPVQVCYVSLIFIVAVLTESILECIVK